TQLFTHATAGLDGGVHAQAAFGTALVAADFDGDGHDDLAVGCPRDLVGATDEKGSVTVLRGAGTGFFGAGLLIDQDVTDVPIAAEDGDGFGSALAAADYDGDGHPGLAIGTPGKQVSGVSNAGGLIVLDGDATTLLDLAQSLWIDKLSPAIPGNPGSNAPFGSALGN